MVGPAGLMALWMIAATPASAMFDVDGQNDEVKQAILRNEVFVRGERAGGVWNAPLPPPRMLPYDPAYESAGPAPRPSSEGIPGLPPVEETPKPPPPPPKKIIERRDVINYDEDFGEAVCSDEGAGDPCGYDCGCRPGRQTPGRSDAGRPRRPDRSSPALPKPERPPSRRMSGPLLPSAARSRWPWK